MDTFDIYLASQSPRRRELLTQIGVRFQVLPVDVHEAPDAGESAQDYVRRVALDKARAGAASPQRRLDRPVLGSDTEVVVDGEVQGKPRDAEHGLAMLARLSGRSHQVLSAVALVRDGREEVVLSASTVYFRPLSDTEIRAYWATGEPADKAGGYAIQGRAAVFVERLEGSFSGVMGLPLYETAMLLKQFGVDVV
jgi:septum formation protein